MDQIIENNSEGPTKVSEAAKEVVQSVKEIVSSEVRLAIAEAKAAGRSLGRHAMVGTVAGVVAALGVFPLIAFLVIGLGRILGDNYWLSSLIIGLLFVGTGGLVARAQFKRIGQEDVAFPHTRMGLEEASRRIGEQVGDNVRRIADFRKEDGLAGQNESPVEGGRRL